VDYLQFALLGLGSGAIIAAIGLGVVLSYRGSGVINFAHGAVAMYVAYLFVGLRQTGDYFLPIPGLPAHVHLARSVDFTFALLLSLLTAVALGLVLHYLVFRPLRNAPILAKVVASVGVLLTLQAIIVLRFGTESLAVPPVLPSDDHALRIGRVLVPDNRFYLAAVVLVAAAALALLYRRTRFGLATRAAAENEKGAVLIGYSPDRQAGINWVLASLLAGGAGILIAPIVNLSPVSFTLLIVPALGAALLGRLSSFMITAAAGLGLGMLQGVLLKLQIDHSWFPQTGAADGVPFVLIIVAMFVLGRRLPSRGSLFEGRLPAAPLPRRAPLNIAIYTAIAVLGVLVLSSGWRLALINTFIGAIICLSFVVLTGYVGQISLAQIAIAGTAGFMLSTFGTTWGIPFPVAPLLAALVATVLGLIVAVPALRIRGVNLAIVTLAAAVAVENLYFDNPKYTGGFTGAPVPDPKVFGVDLSITKGSSFPTVTFALLCLAILLVLALAVMNLRHSGTGRRMLAVRDNERAAAAAGVSVAATKLMAFGLSAFIAGLGGTLIAYQRTNLSAASFGIFTSLTFLAIAYLGGITTVQGSMWGGLLATGGLGFYALDRAFGLGPYQTLIAGLGLILTAVLNQEGIAGAMQQTRRQIASRWARRAGPPPPAYVPFSERSATEA
jgi:ABC-type branched-subunit amino acid transport system permease subunit